MKIRESIVSRRQNDLARVEISGIGGVYIAPMSARDMCSTSLSDLAGNDNPDLARVVDAMCSVCAVCVRDSDGERAFTGGDDPALGMLDMDTLTAMFNACMTHSGMDEVEIDAAALEGHRSDPTGAFSGTSGHSPLPSAGQMYSPSPTNSPPASGTTGRRTPRTSAPSVPNNPTTSTG